jgi:tetratricopeptide (TPR) repeat protein
VKKQGEDIERVLESERLTRLGNQRLKAGDRDRAAGFYHEAILLDGSSAEAMYGLGLVYWRSHNTAEAEYWGYFAQAIHKSWFPAKKLLSHTLLAQDEYEAAFSILNRAVREAPRSGMAEIGATDSALMGLWQERKLKDDYWAERYLRDALRYDREDYVTRHVLVAMDRSDPFLDYFMVAAGRFDPFLADVHHALARVLQRRGKTTEAPAHYRMARQLDATIELDPMCLEIVSNAELDSHPPKGRLASAVQVRAAWKRKLGDVHPGVGGKKEVNQHANNVRDVLVARIEPDLGPHSATAAFGSRSRMQGVLWQDTPWSRPAYSLNCLSIIAVSGIALLLTVLSAITDNPRNEYKRTQAYQSSFAPGRYGLPVCTGMDVMQVTKAMLDGKCWDR